MRYTLGRTVVEGDYRVWAGDFVCGWGIATQARHWYSYRSLSNWNSHRRSSATLLHIQVCSSHTLRPLLNGKQNSCATLALKNLRTGQRLR